MNTNTTNQAAIHTLQHLLDVCTDGIEGYRRAAAAIEGEAHGVLARNAAEREEIAAVLTNELVALGHPPPHHGSVGGAMHRGWLMALGAVHAERPLLHECMRGERATVDAFAQALAAELPPRSRSIVQSQLSRVLTALERVDGVASGSGLPPPPDPRGIEADIGATVGLVSGAAAGAIAGPIGAMVGATVGCIVGEATGAALHADDHRKAIHDHELDDAIGVTKGPIGAGAPITFVDPPAAITFLRADHDQLEAIGEEVVKAIEENDRAETAKVMSFLQRRVREHLEREERELLPAYAAALPQRATRIRLEHLAFTRTLDEMEIATDLHTLRAETVRALLKRLRTHAKREDKGMYAWTMREARKGAA